MNSKGIELSVNFLVTFILAIVVFGFGLVILNQIFGSSEKTINEEFARMEQSISRLACSAKDIVCVSNQNVRAPAKKLAMVGVHVFSTLSDQKTFKIEEVPGTLKGFDKDNAPITTTPITITVAGERVIAPKTQEDFAVGIYPLASVEPGQYSVILKISYEDTPGSYTEYKQERVYFTVP